MLRQSPATKTSAKASFRPTVETLEERTVMNGAMMGSMAPARPQSPLTPYMLQAINEAYSYQVFLDNAPYAFEIAGAANQLPGVVGTVLRYEQQLQGIVRTLESWEQTAEAWGYDGTTFRQYDQYFKAFDQSVMDTAVWAMQTYYAEYGYNF